VENKAEFRRDHLKSGKTEPFYFFLISGKALFDRSFPTRTSNLFLTTLKPMVKNTTRMWIPAMLLMLLACQIATAGIFEKSLLKKRRKGGRGGGSDLEFFKDNLDIFIGPSFNMASGPFAGSPVSLLKSTNTSYLYSDSPSKYLFFFMAGAQYRFFLNPKSEGFQSFLSFGAGLMYQKRGYSHTLQMINKSITLYEDKIVLLEKYRAHYVSVPLSVRIGKQVFGEVGVTADILASGTLAREMERGTSGDSIFAYYYSTFYKNDYKTSSVQPKVSLGYMFGAGYEFTENFGMRLFGTLSNKYFIKGPDLSNFQFSIQFVGTLN